MAKLAYLLLILAASHHVGQLLQLAISQRFLVSIVLYNSYLWCHNFSCLNNPCKGTKILRDVQMIT